MLDRGTFPHFHPLHRKSVTLLRVMGLVVDSHTPLPSPRPYSIEEWSGFWAWLNVYGDDLVNGEFKLLKILIDLRFLWLQFDRFHVNVPNCVEWT